MGSSPNLCSLSSHFVPLGFYPGLLALPYPSSRVMCILHPFFCWACWSEWKKIGAKVRCDCVSQLSIRAAVGGKASTACFKCSHFKKDLQEVSNCNDSALYVSTDTGSVDKFRYMVIQQYFFHARRC